MIHIEIQYFLCYTKEFTLFKLQNQLDFHVVTVSSWNQLMVRLLWAPQCGRMRTLELFVIFWKASKPQELQMGRVFVVTFDISVAYPKTRWHPPIWKEEYIAFNALSKLRPNLFLFFLVPLFASLVWLLGEKWRNAVSECFCLGRGRQDAVGRVSSASTWQGFWPHTRGSFSTCQPSKRLPRHYDNTYDFPIMRFYPLSTHTVPCSRSGQARDRKVPSSWPWFRPSFF